MIKLPVHSLFIIDVKDDSVLVTALNESGKIQVTWSIRMQGGGQVSTYVVQYRKSGSSSYHNNTVFNATTHIITNLSLGTVYEVRVASMGPLGLSGYCCGNGKQATTYNSKCTYNVL